MRVNELTRIDTAIAITIIIAVSPIIGTLVATLLSQSIQVDPLEVRAGGIPNCVTIELGGTNFVINGTRFSGHIVIGFGEEFKSILLDDIARRGGRAVVCFSRDAIVRELTRMREVYRDAGVFLSDRGFVEGLSTDEVASRLGRRYAAVTVPTLSITLWMYDSNGFVYIYNVPLTSQDIYMAKGFNYMDAFKQSLKDPMAVVREGVTISIPPIDKLYPFIASTRVNISIAAKEIFKRLGIANKTFTVLPSREALETSAVVSGSESGKVPALTSYPPSLMLRWIRTGADGYIYNYWGFPTYPPSWWRSRAPYMYSDTWNLFVKFYGSAYLYKKWRFIDEGDLRRYINSISPCTREGVVMKMDDFIGVCLVGSGAGGDWWVDTYPSGTTFYTYTPFIVEIDAASTILPPMYIMLTYSMFYGYNIGGVSILGQLIYSYKTGVVTLDTSDSIAKIPDVLQNGVKYVVLAPYVRLRYVYDAFILVWNIQSYNSTHWIAIPMPIIIPLYYIEYIYPLHTWDHSFYDSSGKCISSISLCFVDNLDKLLDHIKLYTYYGYTRHVNIYWNRYDLLPTGSEINFYPIDDISGNDMSVSSDADATICNIALSIGLSALTTMFGVPPWTEPAANILGSIAGALSGITIQTFRGSAGLLKLRIWRGLYDNAYQYSYVKIAVYKVTHGPTSYQSVYVGLGDPKKVPLVTMYVVEIR